MIETLKNPGAAQEITAFLEENGELVLEAESGAKTGGTTHNWTDQTVQSDSSGSYLRALPDIGQRMGPVQLSDNPSLGYKVNVTSGGDYAIWVRGMAPDPGGDSLHVSIDGSHVGALSGFGMQEWTWSKLNIAGGDVTAALNGLHDLDLHMREDGLRIDKVVLTNQPTNQPSNQGPAESATGTISTNETRTTISYSYDKLYRLTDTEYSGGIVASYEYEYDKVGNMVAYTDTVAAQTTIHTRVFNAMNQMASETQADVGTKAITYDQNGNMVRITPDSNSGVPIKLYSYNQRNLMTRAQEQGAALQTVAEFRYDGNNDRLEQTAYENGSVASVTAYTNDTIGLTQMLVSDGGAGNVIYQLYGNTLLGQQLVGSSQFQTYITDGLGSVRVEMESSGATNYVRTYSPFGETLDETGNRSSVYGYTGQQEDESTGLIYLRARYYSAELKAFTAYDLWEGVNKRPQSLNHYAYVTGNPVNYFDPTGRCNGVFKFIRRAERQACENFDAAKGIANHQDATFWEKTMARSYRTTFVASHVGLAVGGGYLAANVAAVPAAATSLALRTAPTVAKAAPYLPWLGMADDALVMQAGIFHAGNPEVQRDLILMQQIAAADGQAPFGDIYAAGWYSVRGGKRLLTKSYDNIFALCQGNHPFRSKENVINDLLDGGTVYSARLAKGVQSGLYDFQLLRGTEYRDAVRSSPRWKDKSLIEKFDLLYRTAGISRGNTNYVNLNSFEFFRNPETIPGVVVHELTHSDDFRIGQFQDSVYKEELHAFGQEMLFNQAKGRYTRYKNYDDIDKYLRSDPSYFNSPGWNAPERKQ